VEHAGLNGTATWAPEHPFGTSPLAEVEAPAPGPAIEVLHRVAWEIGEKKPAETYQPKGNHTALGMVTPHQGFAHWRILPSWIDQAARKKGEGWRHCRLVLRLYDVTFIEFNGFNAHRIQDHDLPGIVGQTFFTLARAGTWQLGEVGFLLRGGEFMPAARSQVTAFAPEAASPTGGQDALLVENLGRVEEVANLWDQERILNERHKPLLRKHLRLAAFTFEALPRGQHSTVARFASELALHQKNLGHEVHVFTPAGDGFQTPQVVDGVHYHPVPMRWEGSPVDQALSFARGTGVLLETLPAFDLYHIHEWMAGLAPWVSCRPTVLSATSLEATRRQGAAASPLSREIQRLERQLAHDVDAVLTPDGLRERACSELGLGAGRVHPFPMEARLPDEWEFPLDVGKVKMGIGFGPFDRLLLYIGPLEHPAGVDLLVEALPTLLHRCSAARLAFAGSGPMHGHLEGLARHLGIGHAVRVLGDLPRDAVIRLLRAAEALALPSRQRIPWDDAVVDMARRAGKPVVTTHGGPAHLVRHEENGIITYDNPNSMVWALERVLREPEHARQLGLNGKRGGSYSVSWGEVTSRYLDLCASLFPELTERSR